MSTKHNITVEDVVTSIRLPRDQHRQLKDLAAREHRTLSQQVRHMIEIHVRDNAEREAA